MTISVSRSTTPITVSDDAAAAPPKAFTASSTPPTRRAPSPSARTFTPSGVDEILPKTLAGATVDCLLHHAHLGNTTGDSVRLVEATTAKGVMPLTP
jgi:hypothetical protein